ncbi:hypothetical protein [Niveispirillum cyanobacteriorum]|nr:hypothetical protein [Niveispirillum cyanobacteriorum]GGE89110.1 hypothetical protein GCM10011317_52650 [Niveispirillum cyanobacteriorum]
MDRLTYRLVTALTTTPADHGTLGLFQRLADAGELADGRILSVDAPASAITRLLESTFANRSFTFPSRSWTGIAQRTGEVGLPLFLADREREVEVTATNGLVQPRPRAQRLRTVDGLFGRMPGRCSLLHVNDGRFSVAILLGAENLLATQRPLVLIGISSTPVVQDRLDQLNAVASLLAQHDYVLIDSMLLSVNTPEFRQEAVLVGAQTGFLAIPVERDRDALVRNLLGHQLDLPSTLSGDDLVAAALVRGTVPRRAAVMLNELIAFDDDLVCDGFYSTERDGDLLWRWSGPFTEALACIPLRYAGTFGLELGVRAAVQPQLIESLRIYVDGERLPAETCADGNGWLVHVRFKAPLDRFRGWFELRLAYGGTAQLSHEDSRRFGLCISHCRLQRIDA